MNCAVLRRTAPCLVALRLRACGIFYCVLHCFAFCFRFGVTPCCVVFFGGRSLAFSRVMCRELFVLLLVAICFVLRFVWHFVLFRALISARVALCPLLFCTVLRRVSYYVLRKTGWGPVVKSSSTDMQAASSTPSFLPRNPACFLRHLIQFSCVLPTHIDIHRGR